MKKLLSALLTVVLFATTVVCVPSLTASAVVSGYYEYTVKDNKATITYISKNAYGSIEIPSVIDGYSVTALQKTAFGLCEYVTSVAIPDSVTSIPNETFYGSNIAEIHVDENNPQYASQDGVLFNKNKTSLLQYPPKNIRNSYNIPDGVRAIGKNAFQDCDYLTSVTFPKTLTNIYEGSFYDCDSISSLTFPDSLVAISALAFQSCSSLTNITFGKGIKEIQDGAFTYCENISNVNITNLAGWCEMTMGAGMSNPLYYADNLSINGVITNKIVVPDEVTKINDYVFTHCNGITSVTKGKNCKKIGMQAFAYCSYLTSVIIPYGVTLIDQSAFASCMNLQSIYLPNTIEEINTSAFNACYSLRDVYYGGTASERSDITVMPYNNVLNNVFWNWNKCIDFSDHTYKYSCDNECDKCASKRTEVVHSATGATCTTPDTCRYCGIIFGEPFGHKYDSGKVTKKATCKAAGVKTYTCSICKATKTSTIAKLITHTYSNACDKSCNVCKETRKVSAHKYSNKCDKTCNVCKATRTIKHTYSNACDKSCNVCKAKRTIKHEYSNCKDTTCNVCKFKRKATQHKYTNACDRSCNVCKATRKVPAHKYSNACDKTCNVCKATRKAPAHKYSNKCDVICNVCKAKRTIKHTYSNACDKTCNVCKVTRKVPAHKYSNKCDTTCNVCKAKRTIKHTYSNACDKTCNVCKATRKVPAHKYSNKCDATCNVCKAKRTIKHKYSNACDATCNICKAKRKAPHKYSNNCDTNCNICKAKRTIKHTYSNACDKSCNVCKATRKVPAHKYSNACDKTCNVCKATRKVPAHKYSNNCDTTCNVCKAKRTIKHSYKTTTTKATTAKDGKIVKKCSVCGTVASTTTVKYAKTFTLSTTSYIYDGEVKKPSVTVKDSAGNVLKNGTDYTLSYPSGCKNSGTYTVTVTMKGNYSGTKTLYFTIESLTPEEKFKKYCTYEIEDGEIIIQGIDDSLEGNFTIPSIVDGYPVTKIGSHAFNTWSLTSVEIPASVTNIDDYAFYNCFVENINVSSNNKYYSSIDGVLFNKDKTILIMYPLGKIDETYTVPNNVKTIGDNAFNNGGSLKSITLPSSIVNFGYRIFYNCPITKITIPASVTNIDSHAFEGAVCLENIDVSASNKYFSSVDGVLFNKDKTELICYPEGKKQTSYTIPNTVKKIKDGAFHLAEFKSLTISNNITHIESGAISWCWSLESVAIGSGVKSIDTTWGVFEGCGSLKQITVSDENEYFTSVDGVLFNKDKTELIRYPQGKTNKTYTVPSTVTTIGSNAFGRCENLTSIILGNNVSLIDWNAFYSCYNLKSITLGTSIEKIENAFDFCESLTDVYYKGSKAQKENIDFGYVVQEELDSAKWHYNS